VLLGSWQVPRRAQVESESLMKLRRSSRISLASLSVRSMNPAVPATNVVSLKCIRCSALTVTISETSDANTILISRITRRRLHCLVSRERFKISIFVLLSITFPNSFNCVPMIIPMNQCEISVYHLQFSIDEDMWPVKFT
jgi:hypothetical protein